MLEQQLKRRQSKQAKLCLCCPAKEVPDGLLDALRTHAMQAS